MRKKTFVLLGAFFVVLLTVGTLVYFNPSLRDILRNKNPESSESAFSGYVDPGADENIVKNIPPSFVDKENPQTDYYLGTVKNVVRNLIVVSVEGEEVTYDTESIQILRDLPGEETWISTAPSLQDIGKPVVFASGGGRVGGKDALVIIDDGKDSPPQVSPEATTSEPDLFEGEFND